MKKLLLTAAALAVTIGVSFIIVVAALSSSARDGMLAGVAVPYEGADVVADDLSAEDAARLRNRARDEGAEAALLGWTQERVRRDGRELDDKSDVAEISTAPGLRWQVLEQGRFPTSPGEAAVDANNPHIRFSNFRDRGYAVVEASAAELRVTFRAPRSVTSPTSDVFDLARFRVARGSAAVESA